MRRGSGANKGKNMSQEVLSDCGHLCCDERGNPFHDHFLGARNCPGCLHEQSRERALRLEVKRLAERVASKESEEKGVGGE